MSKEEREARRDERGMQKAIDLLKAHGPVVDRLTDMGHLKAAKNIEAKGGRWDSPEVRDAHKRDRGHGR
ncbi:hypothetical protein ACWCOV_08040 [Kribbella sp. NPDC002412]